MSGETGHVRSLREICPLRRKTEQVNDLVDASGIEALMQGSTAVELWKLHATDE
jgi:hypothetical protein